MMKKLNLSFRLFGSSLVAVFILASCTATATPLATANPTATPTPIPPTATFTPVPSMTETPTLVPTATDTEPPTPTIQLTPQVNPGMNAYCRKGPGTNYYAITFLQAGTSYNVIGQNGLNTWWLVQAPGNVTCWVGDPTSVLLGPVWDVSIVMAPPLPQRPSSFAAIITCHSALHILYVEFSWRTQNNVTGYRLYRNGSLLREFDSRAVSYEDITPPFSVNLEYELEAYNDLGVSERASASFPPCG